MTRQQKCKLHSKVIGPDDGVPFLLIHGLGCNMEDWSPDFLDLLIGKGCRIVLIDNRDAGKSPRLNGQGRPGLVWPSVANKLRLPDMCMPTPPYTISDMAADSVAVLRSLGIQAAHIVGVSMGGMIGQRIAVECPSFALSLTSIMSSSGAPGLPGPDREVGRMLTAKRSPDKTEALAQARAFRMLIAGRMTSGDNEELNTRVETALRYGAPQDEGGERQYAAILGDRSRFKDIARIKCRTAVIHGQADPFVPPGHGRDTANRINGAAYFEIDGMGHEILASNAKANADIVLNISGLA